MSLSNLEQLQPEEAYPQTCNTNDGTGKEEDYQEEEYDVIDREHFRGYDKKPVDGVEDVDVAEDVPAVALADRVLRFVDAGK